jgi:hypothetical protein
VAGRFVTCFPLEFSERKFETDPSLEYRSAYLQCSEAVEALVRGEAVNEFARGFGERNQLERFFNVNAAIHWFKFGVATAPSLPAQLCHLAFTKYARAKINAALT